LDVKNVKQNFDLRENEVKDKRKNALIKSKNQLLLIIG